MASITPDGGSIHALAAAPGAGQIVYAISARGTVLRSSDGARSWSPRKNRFGGEFVRELAVDPATPDVLYVHSFNTLFRSADGGESWSSLLEGFPLYALGIAPSDPKVLYAARDKEVLRSQDSGATWAVVRRGESHVESLAVDPGDSRRVYAGGPGSLVRSDDGGASWVDATPADPQGDRVRISALAIDPRQPSTLYAGEWEGGVFKSEDRGATWSQVWEGPEPFAGLESLKIEPVQGQVYAVFRESQVFRSADGGASWSRIFTGYRITGLDLYSGTTRLYAGTTRGGLYLSEDAGQTWSSANHGFRELAFTQVAADPGTPGLVFATAAPEYGSIGPLDRILLKSADGGASWTSPFGSPDMSPNVNGLAPDPSRPGTWYLATSGGVWKTRDGGEAWERANRGLRAPWEYVAAIALAPSDPDRVYAIGWHSFPLCNSPSCPRVRLFRSEDAAGQWRRAQVPRPDGGFLLGSLAVDPHDAATVYASGLGLYRSTDGGATWAKTGRGLPSSVAPIVADPFASGTLYAVVGLKRGWRVFKSTDHGATWAVAINGVPFSVSVNNLAADPTSPGTLYAATSRGVYVTRNGGKLWTAMNGGLGNRPVFALAVDPLQPDVLYAGREDGLFRFSEENP